jgi:hypothetical protein
VAADLHLLRYKVSQDFTFLYFLLQIPSELCNPGIPEDVTPNDVNRKYFCK